VLLEPGRRWAGTGHVEPGYYFLGLLIDARLLACLSGIEISWRAVLWGVKWLQLATCRGRVSRMGGKVERR
jgi:hypothetical protein